MTDLDEVMVQVGDVVLDILQSQTVYDVELSRVVLESQNLMFHPPEEAVVSTTTMREARILLVLTNMRGGALRSRGNDGTQWRWAIPWLFGKATLIVGTNGNNSLREGYAAESHLGFT